MAGETFLPSTRVIRLLLLLRWQFITVECIWYTAEIKWRYIRELTANRGAKAGRPGLGWRFSANQSWSEQSNLWILIFRDCGISFRRNRWGSLGIFAESHLANRHPGTGSVIQVWDDFVILSRVPSRSPVDAHTNTTTSYRTVGALSVDALEFFLLGNR